MEDQRSPQRPWPTDAQLGPDETDEPERAVTPEHRPGDRSINDPVDDASEDSFPASDPPSFTGSTTD